MYRIWSADESTRKQVVLSTKLFTFRVQFSNDSQIKDVDVHSRIALNFEGHGINILTKTKKFKEYSQTPVMTASLAGSLNEY